MNRYLSSFAITLLLYTTLVAMAFTFLSGEIVSSSEQKEEKRINISLLSQPQISQEKVLEKTEPKIEHKTVPKPKPVVKIDPVKKPEPIIKPEPVVEPTPEPEPIVEEVIEEEPKIDTIETAGEETKEEDVVAAEEEVQKSCASHDSISKSNETNQISESALQAKRDIFLANLVEQINNNKSYPKTARRRSIEGEVDVAFKVLANGNVEDVKMVSGKRVFKKSAISAIENSFPIEVDSSLFEFPKEFAIKISYVLR